MQLIVDTCWMVTRAAGMGIQIKQDKKTAWQASYWEGGKEHEVQGWTIRLPDGRNIPQVTKDYTYLGSSEATLWEGAQDGVRKHVIRTCTKMMRMIGRIGALGERQLRIALGLAIEGSVGFYGRATAIGFTACEEIEQVRMEILRQRGYVSGDTHLQIHGTSEAGGMDHRHAYQHATAVLIDEMEKIMGNERSTPANVAVTAHVRATCIRLGWIEKGDMRDWWPTHLQTVLDEDMVGEAWLLAKLRSNIRMERNMPIDDTGREEGPPLFESDNRKEWQPKEAGPCRIRVGIARAGGVRLCVGTTGRGCEYTVHTKRITAAGIRTWADVTTATGKWLTWAQAKTRHGTLQESDKRTYTAMMNELQEERWTDVRTQWEAQTRTSEWRAWAKTKETVIHEDGSEGEIKRIIAARRTAQCFGGWELKVQWKGDWTDTWVTERHLCSGGKGMTHTQRQQIEHKRKQDRYRQAYASV